jgi:lysyl-tRNA synthetase class 2
MHNTAPRSLLATRAALLARIRGFFAARGVLEVDTPHLGRTTTPDPAIASLEVRAPLRPQWRAYLQTSPEFAMKRLLAGGAGDIYQLAHVFRDGETGRAHLPEFTLLEWYRLGFDEHRLMDEIDLLLAELLPRACSVPGRRISYRAAFMSACDLDPGLATPGELADALQARGVSPPPGLLRRELLDLAMAVLVIPSLGHTGACFVHDYPADQAALAALNPGTPPTAARFEVFVAGMELGNGFRELTDPIEQRRRFEEELATRQRAGQPVPPLDEALLAALAQGLPACAGVAMGVDRVLMLACGARDIREVVPLRPA